MIFKVLTNDCEQFQDINLLNLDFLNQLQDWYWNSPWATASCPPPAAGASCLALLSG